MLIRSGLEIADRYGKKAYVMGTSEGVKLYESVGFKIVEIISVINLILVALDPMLIISWCGTRC